MKTLWSESYRPKTVSDYVFRDTAQKKQVESWIKERAIPHLLFSGAAGVGKCLVGSEEIVVEINTATLSAEQISLLEKYKI